MTAAHPGTRYLVVGFSAAAQIVAGFDRLAALAGAGELRIVDVEFVHSIQGVASTVPAGTVHPGLAVFDAHDAGLLGQSDLDVVAASIRPGSTAAVLLYADGPVLAVLAEWSRGGASVLREGFFAPATGLA